MGAKQSSPDRSSLPAHVVGNAFGDRSSLPAHVVGNAFGDRSSLPAHVVGNAFADRSSLPAHVVGNAFGDRSSLPVHVVGNAFGDRSSLPAHVVGNVFVEQYYNVLQHSPEMVHRFYQESSRLGRPDSHGEMSLVTTTEAINEKILSMGLVRAEMKTVDAQESLGGGVTVLVTGYLTGEDNVKRDFTQSFFLAPQDKGFFVLNDIFRFVEEVDHHQGNQGFVNGTVAPNAPEHGILPQQEQQAQEETVAVEDEEENNEGVYNPSENGEVVEDEESTEEVINEVPNTSQSEAANQSCKERTSDKIKIEVRECKFYTMPGGCKFGKSCKYVHPQTKTEVAPLELNFSGLPIRPGAKECSYYMHTGTCKFATNCKYHHPNPTEATVEQDPLPFLVSQ